MSTALSTDDTDRSSASLARADQLIGSLRSGGLGHLVGTLHNLLDADVALFDTRGNLLASAPANSAWDFTEVTDASANSNHLLSAMQIDLEGEPLAFVATRANSAGPVMRFAAQLITMEFDRLRSRLDGKRELAHQILDDVLHGHIMEHDALTRLRQLGLDTDQPHRVLIGKATLRSGRRLSLPWHAYALMHTSRDPFVRTIFRDCILTVLPAAQPVDRLASSLLQHLHELGTEARVGVGNPHAGVAGIRASYFEALTAVSNGPGIQIPRTIDIAQLLIATNGIPDVNSLGHSVLDPLITHDREHDGELIKTLRAYLEFNRVPTTASEVLYIHRNTLRYRLKQIEDILDVDLNSTQSITNLWIALQMHGREDEAHRQR